MRLLLTTVLLSSFIFFSACSSPKIINVDSKKMLRSETTATITRGTSNIWYVLGFCGTDAHVVAIDGNVLPQFTGEKSRLGLPYNPEFDYELNISTGSHEFIVALKKCHLIGYHLEGCHLELMGRCNVIVEKNHNYAVKGFGCSPEKGVNFIDLDTDKVITECREFHKVTSPWIHKALRNFMKN